MSGRGTLQHAYHESLRRHGYQPDAAQEHAVARLDDLRRRLEATESSGGGWFARLRRAAGRDPTTVRGLYLWVAGYDRGYSYSSGTYTTYVNTLGAKRQTIAKNLVITLDAGAPTPVQIKCVELNGAGVYSVSGRDENPKSVVLKVTYGAFDEVIAGDLTGDAAAGKDVESTVGPLVGDVEVYKVHHHGSRYSTNDNWLAATTPEVGIIQVGDGNSYGHPTAAALDRMHTAGIKTYWSQTGAGATPNPAWDKVA